MSKIQQAFNILEELLQGKYDPLQFSCDMEQFLFDNFSSMRQESPEVNDVLQEELPEICAEGEPGMDFTDMIEKVEREYKKAKEIYSRK